MRFSIPNARSFRGTLRFLIMVVACPIGSIQCLAGGVFVEPWLQAAAPSSAQTSAQDLPFEAVPVSEQSLVDAESGSLGYGARAIGAMIVVLGLIWITMILLKRYMPHRFGALGHQRRMQVLETLPIGEKRTLALIRIDNAQLLLASTPGSVSLLKEISAERDTEKPITSETQDTTKSTEIRSAQTSSVEPVQNFADVLADEVGTPLQQLTLLRRELEARCRGGL